MNEPHPPPKPVPDGVLHIDYLPQYDIWGGRTIYFASIWNYEFHVFGIIVNLPGSREVIPWNIIQSVVITKNSDEYGKSLQDWSRRAHPFHTIEPDSECELCLIKEAHDHPQGQAFVVPIRFENPEEGPTDV